MITLLDACADANLFAPWFKDRSTWAAWFAFIAALFGLPMTDEQVALYRKHTGREALPEAAAEEAWLICGRRGGKSFVMALVATYLACFFDYAPYLAPGERATVMVIGADKRQARVIIRFIRAMLTRIPMLKRMVTGETAESFDLGNSVTIEVGTASFRTARGYAFAAVLADEIAFWRTDDAAEPDTEILDAIRPGMATIPNAMLICASSPYARRGALWEAWRRHWGKSGAPLVWKATTREMNPSIRQEVVDLALERDPASATAEYLAEFRSDIEALLTREAVEAVVATGIRERPFEKGNLYYGFVDPSGGSSDAMTLGIAHQDGDAGVLDAVREVKPPFSPEAVVSEFANLLKAYGLRSVTGDRYAGEWPRERFAVHGIRYNLAEATRSELYLALVPLINSKRADLLDVPHLTNQLIALERRTSRGGRDLIDHPQDGHDDLANAAAGALWMARDHSLVAPVAQTTAMNTGPRSFADSGISVPMHRPSPYDHIDRALEKDRLASTTRIIR